MEIKDINSTTKLNNGIEMPVLGLGLYKAKDGKEVINSIHYGLEAGYRHFDTASMYENEEGVGEAIKTGGVPREEIFVTTKVWNDDHGFDNTLKAFEISNNKLGLEYVDLYLVHWPVPGKFVDTYKALEKLYKDERVKAIGMCNCHEHHLNEIFQNCEIPPTVLQNEFHPRLVQQPLLDFCKAKDIRYEAWSPLMRGEILDNKVIKGLAEKHNKTVAQIVIRWDLQKGVITIPKSVHRERIFENADVFDFQLSREEMKTIDVLDREERTGADPDDFMDYFKNKENS